MTKDQTYDAIVVGGGHNGLINGAYLAKAGLRTLILERHDIVGGAAITEELFPGFQFTTFSYALSQLRPQIVHELELVKYGFMPLLMESNLTPMENGDYLLLGQDEQQNTAEIRRHSQHDADAFEQFSHDVAMVVQAIKPLLDSIPPDITSTEPEELMRMRETSLLLSTCEVSRLGLSTTECGFSPEVWPTFSTTISRARSSSPQSRVAE